LSRPRLELSMGGDREVHGQSGLRVHGHVGRSLRAPRVSCGGALLHSLRSGCHLHLCTNIGHSPDNARIVGWAAPSGSFSAEGGTLMLRKRKCMRLSSDLPIT
jgi:hypothetical protein